MKKDQLFDWTCANCGASNQQLLNRAEAAFFGHFIKEKQLRPCPQCGGRKMRSSGIAFPELDDTILRRWATDDDLYFISQDEDLLISLAPFETLKKWFDAPETLKSKRMALFSAIMVKLHDECFVDDGERAQTVAFVVKHRDQWEAMDVPLYVQRVATQKV